MISRELQEVAERAMRLYDERLRAELEPAHRDQFVAIEPTSGDYFLGRTLSEAAWAASGKYPDRQFYALRIGHPVAVEIGHSPA